MTWAYPNNLTVVVAPGAALLQINQTTVDVTSAVSLECSLVDGADSGNPSFDTFVFKNNTDENNSPKNDPAVELVIQTVNQRGPYHCLASNDPTAAVRQYGETSVNVSLIILGRMFSLMHKM